MLQQILTAFIVIFANLKGGVTKTTSLINTAMALFLLKKRVLIIDLDFQGNTSTALGISTGSLEHTVYTFMCGKSTFEQTRKKTYFDKVSKRFVDPSDNSVFQSGKIKRENLVQGPDLLPLNIAAVTAENELISNPQWGTLLRNALAQVRDQYDYILIDTHPDLSKMTVNGYMTADCVVIPTVPEKWPTDGLITLCGSITDAQKVNANLYVGGLLFAKVKYAGHGEFIEYIQNSLVPDINTRFPSLQLSCFQAIINESAMFLKSTNNQSCVVLTHPMEGTSLSYWAFLVELLKKSKRESDYTQALNKLKQLHEVHQAREDKRKSKVPAAKE